MRAARAPFVCVMDADLQHPPGGARGDVPGGARRPASDMVVASRFCVGGDTGAFGRLRSALSRVSSRAAMLLFPKSLWHVSDPMSGCFLVRREAVDLDRLRPRGIQDPARDPGPDARLARVRGAVRVRRASRRSDQGIRARGAAVSRTARPPGAGSAVRAVRPLHRRGRHRAWSSTRCCWRLFADVAGIYYVVAAILATQGSTLWNFCLTERLGVRRSRARAQLAGVARRCSSR